MHLLPFLLALLGPGAMLRVSGLVLLLLVVLLLLLVAPGPHGEVAGGLAPAGRGGREEEEEGFKKVPSGISK